MFFHKILLYISLSNIITYYLVLTLNFTSIKKKKNQNNLLLFCFFYVAIPSVYAMHPKEWVVYPVCFLSSLLLLRGFTATISGVPFLQTSDFPPAISSSLLIHQAQYCLGVLTYGTCCITNFSVERQLFELKYGQMTQTMPFAVGCFFPHTAGCKHTDFQIIALSKFYEFNILWCCGGGHL